MGADGYAKRIGFAARIGMLAEDQSATETHVMNADETDKRRLEPAWRP